MGGALGPITSGFGRVGVKGLALIAALLAALSLAWWWWAGAATSGIQQLIVPIARSDIENSVGALGTLQPRTYVDVGTQVSGQVKSLNVEIGATVQEGELLAEIDPAILNTKVASGRAQLKSLRAQLVDRQALLELAVAQFGREKTLKAAKASSEDAYQIAFAGMKSAEASRNVAKAQIEQTAATVRGDEVNLGYSKIPAPMSGTVVSIAARQGQTLNANQQAPVVLRIADLRTMTVWTQVSEADVPKLKLGMPAYFTILGAPNKRWQGTLRQILPTPEVVNNVVLFTALFEAENASGELMPQMTAQVFFVISSAKDALSVPVAALRRSKGGGDGFKVTVAGADGEQSERDVKVGVSNRIMAEVLSGLKLGDLVVAGTATAEKIGSRSALDASRQSRQGGGPGGPP
jgi:membrane fusion protein, macrolide-specific efflux system